MVAPLIQLTNRLTRVALEMDGFRSRKVRTSGGRVHVLDVATGGTLPTLVLLHGISSEAVHFLPLFPLLRGRGRGRFTRGGAKGRSGDGASEQGRDVPRRIVAIDLPAHGESDVPRSLDPDALRTALIEALDDVLDERPDEPAVLFGNSMGGMAAIQYAIARPARVSGLILASPSGASMPEAELRAFLASFSMPTHADALRFVDRLFARTNPLRQLFAWGVRHQFEAASVKALLRATTADDMLTPEQIGSLRMPTLLLWGREERILPRDQLAYFRRYLPAHARIEEPAGFGHAPYLDDPVGVARRILAFMKEIEERGYGELLREAS